MQMSVLASLLQYQLSRIIAFLYYTRFFYITLLSTC